MTEYHLPGIHVREQTVTVPLDWNAPGGEQIEVFVRELVDPDRRTDDLPLLTYLQGGPGGANPRPVDRSGWIDEALKNYRIVLVDQRGTGRSTPIDAQIVAERGDDGADYLACFRADSIVRDLEHVRTTVYEGRRWATIAQSFGGWITLAYLSHAPEALSASYVCGGIPGIPADANEVYRRTFSRVADKTAEYYRRHPGDIDAVARIADHLAAEDVRLPDGDRLTVHRFQSLGIDFGMKPGFERMHWLIEDAFIRPGRLSEGFLAGALARTSSAANPLFWTLQESIYGDGGNGPIAWAAQRERDRRPEFDGDRRPLLFTGEMAFPWMFDEVRLLRGFAPAVQALAERPTWSTLYDVDRLAANEVPVAAAVYFDDMYVDADLQLQTLRGLGNAQHWVTNEFEHDGIGTARVFERLRELVRDRGGER
ncbi:alpha/beta fold hydrolase [Microbacterium invictum]|uniref:Pimeloyl-ACP methyl ester carboxylesterase n=1 Tax=Microbacterium invictum TaxID=515415 RepID=A0AA40SPI4_9MICO|nr:alpha/beta fold hydrolase [Microbacterium invictum]MBB4139961.1 pimeloyl-ACP methyl ester carboxylesterase [Microbacterium invictum]